MAFTYDKLIAFTVNTIMFFIPEVNQTVAHSLYSIVSIHSIVLTNEIFGGILDFYECKSLKKI